MRLNSGVRLAAAMALLCVSPVVAQDSTVPEQLQGMVGDWRLEQEDQTLPICALKFTDEEAIGGWAIEVPEVCPPPYPASDSFVAWNVDDSDGSVILLDAERHVVLRLFEDEDGLYDTDPAIEPRFYLLYPYVDDGSGGEVGDEVPD